MENFTDMAGLKVHDLDADISVNIRIQKGPSGHVLIGIFPEHLGDIEVAFQNEDCARIAALMKQALKPSTDQRDASIHDIPTLTHHFENLDGGKEAAFTVQRVQHSVVISINRSDEGDLAFRTSSEDAKRFMEVLNTVCGVGKTEE